jgi:hypothetical protein
MIAELVDLLNEKRPATLPQLDKDRVTIRCLPHVLHLAVTELLKALKSLSEDEELDAFVNDLTEEQAELHAERTAGKGEDDDIPMSDADLAYAILKVRFEFINICSILKFLADSIHLEACAFFASTHGALQDHHPSNHC